MKRIKLVFAFFGLTFFLIIGRLFYWQTVKSESLTALAKNQYFSSLRIQPERGQILANDGFPLVANQPAFLAFFERNRLEKNINQVLLAEKIAPILAPEWTASLSAKKKEPIIEKAKNDLIDKLNQPDLVWIPLARDINLDKKNQLAGLDINNLNFQSGQKRFYPEASMAAHLLGFVGKNDQGDNQGYFGLEGFYDLELKGQPGIRQREKDALGRPILSGDFYDLPPKPGSHLQLFLDRGIQFMVEEELKKALKRYGAKSGTVTIMDPKTGAITAMASLPAYAPDNYTQAKPNQFKNPVISETYEPGSTFKTIVMASALDAGVVKRDDCCTACNGPVKIGKYTITTWDDKYYPNSNLDEILIHSDNVGMVWLGQQLGLDKLKDYLNRFGFGQKTGIDLQEEVNSPLKKDARWGQIGLATASFGQGIAVSRIQMIRAVAALANQGQLVEPHLVKKLIDEKKTISIKPNLNQQVIQAKTARIITEIMVKAVKEGEAKWTVPEGYKIAGKTGTSQIPIKGQYDKEKTIASFIGFAPADEPKFVMLTTLKEPASSPWGSETAAPLFFNIAQKLFLYYGIPPS